MIIVYGGTFNPPTIAHYEIIELLLKKFCPDEIFILPVGPHYNKPGVENFHNRFMMCNILANKLGVKVSDMENEKTYRGTYYTLKEFAKIDHDVYFVMGADNFDYLDKWINAENLVKEFKFIILTRDGFDIDKIKNSKFKQYHDHFYFVEYHKNISASKYRLTKNSELILPEIEEFIKKNNLYEVN